MRALDAGYSVGHGERVTSPFEVEFRWKEMVIYWEGTRGVVFNSGWGVEPAVTIVPDSSTWDRVVPDWLAGRRNEVIARLGQHKGHVVVEERDDSLTPKMLETVTR